MVSVALASLKADFIGPRHDILEALAQRLALNGELDLMARLRHWAQAYGKIANPASVLKIEAPGLNTNGEFLGRHVEMIGRSLQIIGKGRGVADDPNLGSSSFALLAAYDMASDVGDLGGFAEVVLARKLRLSR